MTDYEEYNKIFLDMASQQIDNNELIEERDGHKIGREI